MRRFVRAAVAALIFSTLVTCSLADQFRFIVTGDGRSGKNRPEDKNGVNVVIMAELAKAMVAEKPDLLLFSGDLIVGPKSDDEMESQLRTWLEVMKPVYDAGIKVYPIRRNHEMHVEHPDAVWRKVFTGPLALPQNGPKGEEAMNYTVSHKGVLFIGVDEFISEKSLINQKWIDEVLAKHKEQHVFAFAHKMAFRSGNHDDGLETEPEVRDAFVKSMIAAGSRVGFFGHDHLYDHRSATAPGAGEDRAYHQFVIGTAGAPLVHGKSELGDVGNWKVTKFSHIEDRYGYMVVDVDGPKVSLTFKARKSAGVFETADTFTYSVTSSQQR